MDKLEAAESREDVLSEGALAEMFNLTDRLEGKAAPVKAEPVKAEPVVEEAVEEEIARPDPVKAEPVKDEPVKAVVAAQTEIPKEEKPLLTKFKVYDQEGELEVDPALKFAFKANGKEYEDVPLDKLVLLAQMGFYNQEREERIKDADTFKPQAEQQLQKYASAIQRLTSEYANLFEDPSYYETARAAYFEENTPEKRAQRAESERDAVIAQTNKVAEQAEASSYVATVLTPAVEILLKTYPSVSYEELMGRMSVLTAPLVASGVPVKARLAETKRLVDTELSHWVKGLHVQRDVEKKSRDADLIAEKTRTALAKRQLARTVQPKGVPAPASPAAPPKFESARDWLDTVLPPQFRDED